MDMRRLDGYVMRRNTWQTLVLNIIGYIHMHQELICLMICEALNLGFDVFDVLGQLLQKKNSVSTQRVNEGGMEGSRLTREPQSQDHTKAHLNTDTFAAQIHCVAIQPALVFPALCRTGGIRRKLEVLFKACVTAPEESHKRGPGKYM